LWSLGVVVAVHDTQVVEVPVVLELEPDYL
jgi:hypothetical protein